MRVRKNKNTSVSCWRSEQMCFHMEHAKHIPCNIDILTCSITDSYWKIKNSKNCYRKDMYLTSKTMKSNPLFMRNSFVKQGRWNIPLIRKQQIDTSAISLIACSDTRSKDNPRNCKSGVHFFVDDYRFEGVYNNPKRTLERYSQYAFLLSPDFSTYADMDLWRQLENVAKNRWVGAYWQSNGLTVIPTISWSTPRSFDFCFDGVEQNAIVAISTLGCKQSKLQFMRGYDAMLDKLNPATIICFDNPFPEMEGNIIKVDYRASRKVVR